MGGERGEAVSTLFALLDYLPWIDRSTTARPRASPTPFSCSIDRSSFSPSGGAAGESISSVEDLLLSEQVIRKNQIDHRKPRT